MKAVYSIYKFERKSYSNDVHFIRIEEKISEKIKFDDYINALFQKHHIDLLPIEINLDENNLLYISQKIREQNYKLR